LRTNRNAFFSVASWNKAQTNKGVATTTPQVLPPTKQEVKTSYNKPIDLEKLYHAVAVAESGNCSTAWHQKAKNCVSIMTWEGGYRHLKTFPSIEASKRAFKELWKNHYGNKFPGYAEAKKYTGNDNPANWLSTVIQKYNQT